MKDLLPCAWKFALANKRNVRARQPILAGGHVYQVFIFDSGAGSASLLICFDAKTGERAWEHHIEFVANQPVVGSAGTVYVTAFDGSAHALSADGRVQWRTQHGKENIFAPVVLGSALLFAETGGRAKYTWCLEQATGAIRWKFESGSHAYSLAAAEQCVVHAVTPQGDEPARLICLSLAEGALLWVSESPVFFFKPVVVGKHVHVGARDSLRTHDLTTGVELARLPLPGVNLSSALLALEHNVVFGDESGMVRAAHFDGQRWLHRWQHQCEGDSSALPVAFGNAIACHSQAGTVTVLDAASGSERGQLAVGSKETLGGLTFGDGRLFASHERELRCYLVS